MKIKVNFFIEKWTHRLLRNGKSKTNQCSMEKMIYIHFFIEKWTHMLLRSGKKKN